MKKLLQLCARIVLLVIPGTIVFAQTSLPITTFRGFDKVRIENINGEVSIELGKHFGMTAKPPTALSQFSIEQRQDVLVIQLKKYPSEKGSLSSPSSIVICMPEISKLYNFSNADVLLKNFVGRYLGSENFGNGNVTLQGTVVDFLEITNRGNGNHDAKNLLAKKVAIQKQGNGDAIISTQANFTVEMDGNGDVVNFGTGKAVIRQQLGTGKVIYRPL